MEVKVGASLARATPQVNERTPLHVLLVGNFCGTGHEADRAHPKPVLVDRDNLYELPAQLGVRLDGLLASTAGERQSIEFREFEDFEPDQLFERLEIFEHLRTLRRRLQNPKHFDAAAAEVLLWQEEKAPSPIAAVTAEMPDAPSENLLDDILSASPEAAQSPLETGDWDRFIQGVVGESAIQRVDPKQDELVALVDEAIAATMRNVLQGKKFRSLEMNWQGLRFLTFRAESHAKLKIYLLDMTEEQFRETLGTDDWASSVLTQTVTTPSQTPGATPWGVVGCVFPLETAEADLTIAARLGEIAQAAGATALVEVRGDRASWLSETTSAPDGWADLQTFPAMRHVAALWPRIQLRLPYGKRYRPTDTFQFEEITRPGGSQLAWGSPVWLGVTALAQAYNEAGWKLQPSSVHEFTDLPLYYDPALEGDAHPCGEYLLTDSEIGRLIDLGLSPLVSFKNQDRVQIRGLQSLQARPLAGPWSG